MKLQNPFKRTTVYYRSAVIDATRRTDKDANSDRHFTTLPQYLITANRLSAFADRLFAVRTGTSGDTAEHNLWVGRTTP